MHRMWDAILPGRYRISIATYQDLRADVLSGGRRVLQGESTMAAEQGSGKAQGSRLLSCYLKAADDGLNSDSVMLCEVIGDEIQSVSLRVAAKAMTRSNNHA